MASKFYIPEQIIVIPHHLVEAVRSGAISPSELGAYIIMIDAFNTFETWDRIVLRLEQFKIFGIEPEEIAESVSHLAKLGQVRGINNLTGYITKAVAAVKTKKEEDESRLPVKDDWIAQVVPLTLQGKVVDYLRWCKSKNFWPKRGQLLRYLEGFAEGQEQMQMFSPDALCEACYGEGQLVTYVVPGVPTYSPCPASCNGGKK
jgi:hypothetical protein